jgi:hypothetical protein
MYNLNYNRDDIKALREQIKAINARVEETIGAAKGLDQFQYAAYHQLTQNLFAAGSLLHTFWTDTPVQNEQTAGVFTPEAK